MRKVTTTSSALISAVVVLGAVVANGETWKMKVHTSAGVDEYAVAEVDSITFEMSPLDMILVPAGTFIMGDGISFCGEDEREVTLTNPFYLSRYEVTNQQYLDALQWAFDQGHVTANSGSVIDNLDGSTVQLLDLGSPYCEIQFDGVGTFSLRNVGHGINGDHPVKEVSWCGAARYCDWLSLQVGLPRAYEHTGDWSCNGGDPYGAMGYRLLTDAEWEYAAQYNDERLYPWGDEAPDCGRANYEPAPGAACVGWTTPVGSYPGYPNISGELLYDMPGNAREWCNDVHVCSLGTTPEINPTGPPGPGCRVTRGGGWSSMAVDLMCARRRCNPQEFTYLTVGFRCARTQ